MEAVANISGRADILACIFFTSALVLWLRALSCTSLTWRRFLLTAAQVIGVCGALSKESALAVFGVMIIHFGIFLLNRRPKTLQKRRPKERGASHSAAGPTLFLSFSLLIAPLMSLGLFFLIRARLILLVPINRMSYYDNPLMFEWSEHGFLHRLLYAMGVWTEYMRLLLFPRSMAYDYSLQVLPDMEIPQLASSDIIKVATAVITIVSGLFATKTRSSAFCTCFAMLIGPLIPLLSLFFPVGTIVAERTLYTPSVAYVLMVVLTLDFVLRNVRDVGGLDRIFPRGCGEGFSSALTTSTAPPSSSLQEGSSTFLRRRRKVETTSSQHSLPPSSHRSRDLLRQVPALSQIDCSTKSGTEATSRYRRVGLGTAFITVLTLLYCQRCYQVSSAWENNESLYLSGPLLQPYSCKVWSNAGYQFKQLGRNLEAAACTYRAYQLCSWDIAFKMDAAVSHYRLNMLDLTKKLYISAANSDCKQWRYHRKRNSCMSTKEKVYRTLIGFLHKHGSQEEVRVYQEQWKKSVVSYRKEMDL